MIIITGVTWLMTTKVRPRVLLQRPVQGDARPGRDVVDGLALGGTTAVDLIQARTPPTHVGAAVQHAVPQLPSTGRLCLPRSHGTTATAPSAPSQSDVLGAAHLGSLRRCVKCGSLPSELDILWLDRHRQSGAKACKRT